MMAAARWSKLSVRVTLIAILALVLFFGNRLPYSWQWENGLLEWAQVAFLMVGAVLSWTRARTARAAGTVLTYRFWTLAVPLWFLLVGRELSWGRVLFPRGFDENGPYFTVLSDVPYGYLVQPAVMVLILVWIVAAFKHGFYRISVLQTLKRALPAFEPAIAAVALAFSLYAAKHLKLPLAEEALETVAYLGLIAAAWQTQFKGRERLRYPEPRAALDDASEMRA